MAEEIDIPEPETDNNQIVVDLKTAEDLAKKYDYAGRDLEINIDLDFGAPTPLNFVLINPVINSTSSFVSVVDIATANADSQFTTVDGFDSQNFDKILTPEANKVLPSDVQGQTLAPSAFSYVGLGVFSFPLRIAQKLRLTLLVEDPTPNFYERLHILLQEVVTTNTTVTKTKKKLFKKKKKTTYYQTTTVNSKLVKLSYLQTLAVSQSLLDVNLFENQANSGILGEDTKEKNKALEGSILGGLLGGIIGGLFGTKVKTQHSFNTTGYKLKSQWLHPYFDRIRYSIGIKELTIAKYVFAASSEFVSTPFLSPKEIIKVNLVVDEYIPPSFDTNLTWIKYYVKPEGSEEWVEINPTNGPTRFNEAGDIIPKIVNFNIPKPTSVGSENKYNYTTEPIKKLRFRAVFSRPTGGDNDSNTPLLRSYKLVMTPRSS